MELNTSLRHAIKLVLRLPFLFFVVDVSVPGSLTYNISCLLSFRRRIAKLRFLFDIVDVDDDWDKDLPPRDGEEFYLSCATDGAEGDGDATVELRMFEHYGHRVRTWGSTECVRPRRATDLESCLNRFISRASIRGFICSRLLM